MAEFPALPLFTDAYLGDTTHLTTIEHGAYLLLLMVAWRSHDARLPDDDAKLARYAKLTRGQWARIAPVIRDFFHAENGWLYQSRLTDEAKHVRQVRESQRKAGRASALKRKDRHSTDVDVPLNGCATPTPTPTPTISDVVSTTSQRAKRAARLSSDWKPAQPYPPKIAAMTDQWPPGREDREIDGFVDYWTTRSKDAAKLDWDKTWHNRIRDQHDRIMRENRNAAGRTGNGAGGSNGGGDGFTRALRRASAHFGANQSGRVPDDF